MEIIKVLYQYLMLDNMMFRSILTAVVCLASPLVSDAATQLVIWTFGAASGSYTEAPTAGAASGTAVLTLADGDLDANGKDGVAYTDILGTPHDSGQAAAWNDIKVMGPDAEVIIQFSSLGYEDLAVRFDYRSEGAEFFDFAYSLNGTDFTQQLDNEGISVNWGDAGSPFGTVNVNLVGVTSIQNAATVFLRIDDLEEMTGNDKFAFDNLEITGSVIPEPQVALLLGVSLLLGIGRRNRRLSR